MKVSLEEGGRQARYDYFRLLATKYRCDKIATGHTLDDNVETVLFNLARGSGLHGLAGIPIIRGNIIRPLLNIEKKELIDYLNKNKIKYLRDPSNRSMKFSRNRIRHRILPELQKLNPSAKNNIARMSDIVTEELDLMAKRVEQAYQKCLINTGKNKIALDLRKLRGYDRSLKKKVIEESFRLLSDTSGRLSSKTLFRVLEVIDGKSGIGAPLTHGLYIEKSHDRIAIYRTSLPKEKIKLQIPGMTELWRIDSYLESRIVEMKAVGKLRGDNKIAYLDNSKMTGVGLRFWKEGDSIRPLGMTGHKLLSDIFVDRKIPKYDRQHIPLIVSNGEIAWIAGIMISDDFKVGHDTKEILEIKLCVH